MNITQMFDAEPDIAIDTTTLAIRKIESALSEFDIIAAGLAHLNERYPADVVYDVSTGKGMSEAIAHRAAWRDPRIMVEKYRKLAKAPVLTLGKDIDARAAWITEQLLLGEAPIDAQIKVEERRKEDEKQARINAEFGRMQAIQEAIAEIHLDAMAAANRPSAAIAERLDALRTQALDPLVFQEMTEQARQAKALAIDKLELALKAKLYSEGEAIKLAAERAELNELRAKQAAQKAMDDAAAAQARAAEDARLIEQRKAMDEQQRKLDAQAADIERQRAALTPVEATVEAQPVSVPTAPDVQQVATPEGDNGPAVVMEYQPHLVRAMHYALWKWRDGSRLFNAGEISSVALLDDARTMRDAVLDAIGFEPVPLRDEATP